MDRKTTGQITGINRRDFGKALAAGTVGIVSSCRNSATFDLIIRNGMIFDGLGNAAFQADLGIVGDRIKAIGNLGNSVAETVIDAGWHAVAPGFIDIHTHTDLGLIVNPKGESKIHQGVTTEVAGNCGDSLFPLNEADFENVDENVYQEYGFHPDWRDIDGFLGRLEKQRISINYATFTGHGRLRSHVVGRNDVPATDEQITEMKAVLQRSMEQGSFGLSSGLEYAPGSYASTEELVELSKTVASGDGVYATHIRNEDERVEEAVAEALEICRDSGVSLQISHLKANNPGNWDKLDRVLEMIHEADQSGLPVHADRYPYIAYSTGLSIFLPLWSLQGTTEDLMARLNDPSEAKKILDHVGKRGEMIGGWDRVVISSCFSDGNKKWEGWSIEDSAAEMEIEPLEFVRRILLEERNRVQIVGFGMNEDNLRKVLSSPLVMVGSDGNAVAPYGKLGEGKPHPRYYGTFPRVLGKYTREEKLFGLSTALSKMTSMPADKLGMNERGRIAENCHADIVVFNPDTVIDEATFKDPHQFPSGIEYVIVNGRVTVDRGEHTGAMAGKVLRRGA